jgi:hypothetical protein
MQQGCPALVSKGCEVSRKGVYMEVAFGKALCVEGGRATRTSKLDAVYCLALTEKRFGMHAMCEMHGLQSLWPVLLQGCLYASSAAATPAAAASALPTAAAAAGSGLNISLDSLRPERFEQLTRRRGHHKVMESIHTAVRLGFDPVKVGGG